jgi:hypothetical protein
MLGRTIRAVESARRRARLIKHPERKSA